VKYRKALVESISKNEIKMAKRQKRIKKQRSKDVAKIKTLQEKLKL